MSYPSITVPWVQPPELESMTHLVQISPDHLAKGDAGQLSLTKTAPLGEWKKESRGKYHKK